MDVEKYLEKFEAFTKDPTLDAMYWMMQKFENPHQKCKIIHVAGTNGKGSVVEMLNHILIEQGYKVGKYISPHLIQFNERICVNDSQISNKEIEEILIKMDPLIKQYNQTHNLPFKQFEVSTCLAFIYFAQKQCDFVILETGMGGTWDCTNIVSPLISIITSIGHDHMYILGDTLTKIAKNKAGIIKQNSKTIYLELENQKENQEVLNVIKQKCKEENNELYIIQRNDVTNVGYNSEYQYFDYQNYKSIYINLKGKIQIYNTAIVLKTIELLIQKGYKIEKNKIEKSLKTVKHLARFEIINEKPTIIYDGAHNEPAIKNFLENIEQYYTKQKRIYIISILKTKDYQTVIMQLLQDKNALFYVTSGNEDDNYVSKETLYEICKKYGKEKVTRKNNLQDAVISAINKYPNHIICIVGSFYIYGQVTKIIKNIERRKI